MCARSFAQVATMTDLTSFLGDPAAGAASAGAPANVLEALSLPTLSCLLRPQDAASLFATCTALQQGDPEAVWYVPRPGGGVGGVRGEVCRLLPTSSHPRFKKRMHGMKRGAHGLPYSHRPTPRHPQQHAQECHSHCCC
jgi:hypothetical protein